MPADPELNASRNGRAGAVGEEGVGGLEVVSCRARHCLDQHVILYKLFVCPGRREKEMLKALQQQERSALRLRARGGSEAGPKDDADWEWEALVAEYRQQHGWVAVYNSSGAGASQVPSDFQFHYQSHAWVCVAALAAAEGPIQGRGCWWPNSGGATGGGRYVRSWLR